MLRAKGSVGMTEDATIHIEQLSESLKRKDPYPVPYTNLCTNSAGDRMLFSPIRLRPPRDRVLFYGL